MAEALELSSSDNPRVKAVVRLRDHKERRATGRLVAEGWREIKRALAAGLAPSAAFVSAAWSTGAGGEADGAELSALERAGARIYRVTEPLFAKMAYCENPEGVLAVFDQPVWRLEDLGGGADAAALYLVAVGTQKPGNLGAMVRSAEAAGATAMLVADGVVDPFNPNAIRASTGAVFAFPVLSASSDAILGFLAERRVRILAATPDASTPYTRADLAGPVALVIGPEDTGLGPRWLEAATGGRIAIPMRGRIADSLNASAAAAVLLFEAVRQRTANTNS